MYVAIRLDSHFVPNDCVRGFISKWHRSGGQCLKSAEVRVGAAAIRRLHACRSCS